MQQQTKVRVQPLAALLVLAALLPYTACATTCPSCNGTIAGNTTCLMYVSTAASWRDARSYCAGLGLHSTLAFPTTATGHDAIVSAKKGGVADTLSTWMGAFSKDGCNFKTFAGVSLDDLPYSGDKGSGFGGCTGCTGIDDSVNTCCMGMGSGEGWNDNDCDSQLTYFCSSPIGDFDSDGICDWEDPCLDDITHVDGDSDGVCDSADSCPSDVLNDADSDRICDAVDSCLSDDVNDADSDGVCFSNDSCPDDSTNDDVDSDGVCDSVAEPFVCDLPTCNNRALHTCSSMWCEDISVVNLNGMNLTGTIPDSFFPPLSHATAIDLSSNSLTGTLPDVFDNTHALTSFNVLGNFLTGAIPASLGSLESLVELDLSQNRLSGLIPESLCVFQETSASVQLNNIRCDEENDLNYVNLQILP